MKNLINILLYSFIAYALIVDLSIVPFILNQYHFYSANVFVIVHFLFISILILIFRPIFQKKFILKNNPYWKLFLLFLLFLTIDIINSLYIGNSTNIFQTVLIFSKSVFERTPLDFNNCIIFC